MTSYRPNLFLFVGLTCLGLAPMSMARSLESDGLDVSHSYGIVSQILPASGSSNIVGSVAPIPVSIRQRVNPESLAVKSQSNQLPKLATPNDRRHRADFSGMVQTAQNQGKSKKDLIWIALIGFSTIFGAGIFAGLFYMLTNSTVEIEESEIEESESEMVEELNADDCAGADRPDLSLEQNAQNGLVNGSGKIATEQSDVKENLDSDRAVSEVASNLTTTGERGTGNWEQKTESLTDDPPQPDGVQKGEQDPENLASPMPIPTGNSPGDRNSTQISHQETADVAGHAIGENQVAPQPKSPEGFSPPENRSLAIEQTTRLPKIDIIEELIKDLQSSDPTKRRKSIWELGQRGDSRAVQPLVDLIVDSDSKQVNLILGALSEIGTRTLKPMNRALALSLQDRNPDVRKNAIRDLTRIYDLVSQISQLLRHAVDDSDVEVQETARWALNQLNQINTLSSYQPRSTLHNWTHPVDTSPEDLS